MFPAVHSVELPAVHAHVFAVRQAPPAWTPGGSGFRVKLGMTWVWGWVVVYRLFRLVWIPGQARNDVVGPALICGPFSIHELRLLHISHGS